MFDVFGNADVVRNLRSVTECEYLLRKFSWEGEEYCAGVVGGLLSWLLRGLVIYQRHLGYALLECSYDAG